MLIDRSRRLINRLLQQRHAAGETARREDEILKEISARLAGVLEAQAVVRAIAQEIQQRAHGRIASVVSRCLEAVFDDPYEFRIEFEQKRGKTEAVLEFVRDDKVFREPLNEVGGGVIDVAAFALRLAVVMLSRPVLRRVLVLDEPFKNIRGAENRARTRRMLEMLADELGFQFVLNTDIPEYRLGTVVEMD